jgi:hypothetical protein
MTSGYKILDVRSGNPYPDVFETYVETLNAVKKYALGASAVIVPARFHTPFVGWFFFGGKVYPCPAKDEPIAELTYRGSGPKRVMVQEHPCLFPVAERLKKPEVARYVPEILNAGYRAPSKMCHHAVCARTAHRNSYKCPCPAGEEPMPRTYYRSETPCLLRPGETCHHARCTKKAHPVRRMMVREHPCQGHSGKSCHHVFCAWEAHSDDYQCLPYL